MLNSKVISTAESLTSEQEEKRSLSKQRNLRLLENKKKAPTDYFYQISNPAELAKIGGSFLEDFKQGVKSFAISSTDYKSSQQRTTLALACYFDHLLDLKILIISDSLLIGLFSDIMSKKTTEMVSIQNTQKSIEVNHFHHHFDLIDLKMILNLNGSDKPNFEFEHAVQNLLGQYDIIFWDTPTISTYKQNPVTYSQTLMFFESLTIIVAQNVSHSKDINELKEYFSSFGVNIKGVIFDNIKGQLEAKKSRWWSRSDR